MKCLLFLLLPFLNSLSFAQGSEFYAVGTPLGNGSPGNSTYQLNSPFGLAIHPNTDTIYIADQGNHRIKKYIWGTVTNFAGDTIAGYLDSIGTLARFNSPSNLCVDDSGNVYVSDFNNHRIRKINATGFVTTLAGSGVAGYKDGPADSAQFHFPRGIAVDDSGNVFVSDSWNHRIRKISPAGMVSTFAGGGNAMGVGSVGAYVDAADTSARFYTPSGLFYFKYDSCLYLADAFNHRIRKITSSGIVTTVLGTGPSGPGNGGFLNGNTSIAKLNTPTELFIEKHPSTGAIRFYISDTYNNQIREFDLNTGLAYTVVGDTSSGYIDAWGLNARFNFPRGIVIQRPYTMFVCDFNNHALRGITNFWESTDDDSQFNLIKIWPQPASSTLHFSEEIQSLKIYDATGKLILSQSYPTGIQSLPIQDWSPGLYRITGTASSGHSLNQSFLIQK